MSAFVAVLILAVATLADGYLGPVTSIAVAHRHGARGRIGFYPNGTSVCHAPWCELTDTGKQMCMGVGQVVMNRYGTVLGLDAIYNVQQISSKSTAVPRVVVSGEAMLMGMYPPGLPFVDFVPETDDTEMSPWTSWPTWVLRHTYKTEEAAVNGTWVAGLVGQATLDRIAAFTGVDCNVHPMDCVYDAQDTLAANYSAGDPLDPVLAAQWDLFRNITARFYYMMFGYNTTDPYDLGTGSLGYLMASSLLTALANGDDQYVVHHRAVHDLTLAGLYATLGIFTSADVDNGRFVPRFAETLIIELQTETTTNDSWVTMRWGVPNQAPGAANYSVDFTAPQSFRCLSDAQGAVPYTALSCPLADLQRYVESTGPQSTTNGGICYATNDLLQQNGCLDLAAPPAGSACAFYRDKCVAAPCGGMSGVLADPANGFACAIAPATQQPLDAGLLAALIVPSAVVGVALGFVLPRLLSGGATRETSEPLMNQ